MTAYVISKNKTNPDQAVKELFSELLKNQVDTIFMPGKSPYSELPMPMLVSDATHMENLEPLAPVMPFNSARQASSILKSRTGKRTAFFLKPCEKRALFELVKLSQCTLEDAVIVTVDCLGRMENKTYLDQIKKNPGLTRQFREGTGFHEYITSSCRVCTEFTACDTDIHMNLIGCGEQVSFFSAHRQRKEILNTLGLEKTDIPGEREKETGIILQDRTKKLETLTETVLSEIKEMDSFQNLIANCLNCYNCRTACPVCYCKECVFLTDIFSHMPEILLNRAEKKGVIKLPTDTTMFHMTRLAHMSHACVGCGQCSSVCPSDIPVADIFRVVSKNIQEFFGYIPGKNIDDLIPYLNYKKKTII